MTASKPATLAVLVAAGRHPVSGRPMAAPCDGRALGLARRLVPGDGIHVLHAGNPNDGALRDYLGLGAHRLTVLDIAGDADPVPALIDHLARMAPALVLTGARSHAGEDSGMVPYLIAEALDRPLISSVVDADIDGDGVTATQALPGGGRQRIAAKMPAVLTVDARTLAMAVHASARARRGDINVVAAVAPRDTAPETWIEAPARRRQRRLATVAGSAAERMAMLLDTRGAGNAALVDLDAETAARRVLDYLRDEGLLRNG